MQTTIINATVAGGFAFGSFLMGVGGYELAETIISKPKPYGLQLQELSYVDGDIHQLVVPINAEAVPAVWASKISRGERILCYGGAKSNYDGVKHIFTPSEWTGGDCPELQPGDIASASWSYQDVNGKTITLSGNVIIGDEQ